MVRLFNKLTIILDSIDNESNNGKVGLPEKCARLGKQYLSI